jgi:hypothetical protein
MQNRPWHPSPFWRQLYLNKRIKARSISPRRSFPICQGCRSLPTHRRGEWWENLPTWRGDRLIFLGLGRKDELAKVLTETKSAGVSSDDWLRTIDITGLSRRTRPGWLGYIVPSTWRRSGWRGTVSLSDRCGLQGSTNQWDSWRNSV